MPVYYIAESVLHYQIDEGAVFNWSHCWDDVVAGIGVNAVIYTGATMVGREKNFTITVAAVGVSKVELFESVRGHTGGTLVPMSALNRETQISPLPAAWVRYDMAIAGAKGTKLSCAVLPGASILGLGGPVLVSPPWHLLDAESYLLEVHNMSGATSDMSINVQLTCESAHTHAGD